MRKLAFGALFVGLLAACPGKKIKIVDGPTVDGPSVCNVLMQTGCTTGQKCTWIEDDMSSPPLGHIGCAPNGTMARGAACTYMPPGVNGGYDNCMQGDICIASQCKQICDQNGGMPKCATGFACGLYSGVFGPVAGPNAAGACDPTCDPLTNNKFGKATKTGTMCTATQGCYGFDGDYTCAREPAGSVAIFNRVACTDANGCATGGKAYRNGCAQGFIAAWPDSIGSMVVDCMSLCQPADCSQGACGAANANEQGAAPHRCNTVDSSGTFDLAHTNCLYEWRFDFGSAMNFIPTSTEDTVGICIDNSVFVYDPTASTTCTGIGQPSANCVIQPQCSTLPITVGSDNGVNTAGDFGCVNHNLGANGQPVMLEGKATSRWGIDFPHPLYHRTATATP
jgi:hypothetical protein